MPVVERDIEAARGNEQSGICTGLSEVEIEVEKYELTLIRCSHTSFLVTE